MHQQKLRTRTCRATSIAGAPEVAEVDRSANKMNQIDPASIVGEVPNLQGKRIDRLVLQEFWYSGKLEEEANVSYLNIEGDWHRLYFDYGVIFWKESKEEDMAIEPFEDDSGELNQFKLRDFGKEDGIEGKVIEAMTLESDTQTANVKMTFADGSSLVFESIEDNTTLRAEPAASGQRR